MQTVFGKFGSDHTEAGRLKRVSKQFEFDEIGRTGELASECERVVASGTGYAFEFGEMINGGIARFRRLDIIDELFDISSKVRVDSGLAMGVGHLSAGEFRRLIVAVMGTSRGQGEGGDEGEQEGSA